ncbi:MAG: TetR/AcrR family transcriptional regulator [Chloroflexi bacterium]|nr:MAG: TetR/AcrR family transcriptional regulator [Chloroflexota bacterium]
MPRTGRRPGAGGTREKILAAARAQFAGHGYEGATIRGIAASARVDPKLVLHYFETKDGLFRMALDFPFDPAQAIPGLLEPGLAGLGIRLARFFIDLWDSPAGARAHALVRSVVASENAAALMRDFVSREILTRLAQALELDHPQTRASLAASQLVGLAMLRYVVKVEPLASARTDRLARWIGPTLQRYFTDADAITPRVGSRS